MLTPVYTSQFKRDYKLAKKRGLDISLLQQVIEMLVGQISLPEKNKDHLLSGNWSGHRECHIEPDWLLIYKPSEAEIAFVRTGTHADLF